MSLPFALTSHLDDALRAAASTLGLVERGFQPEVRVADPANGDFQANGALAFAKREKQNPLTRLIRKWQATLSDVLTCHYQTKK